MTTRTVPHETAPQTVIHTAWPYHEDWADALEGARTEFTEFLSLVAAPGASGQPQKLVIYVADAESEASARQALGETARYVRAPYGDVWTRDTGPVFVKTGEGLKALRFRFNGWGGKYQYPGDESIGAEIAKRAGAQVETLDWICEGGALEFDGDGTVLTTRDVVLNPNRNPRLSEAQVETDLERTCGVQKVIWLDDGLAGDHTDGHIDNLARFAGPGVVVTQRPTGADDPNATLYARTIRMLKQAKDARGRSLKVIEIPSPGLVEGEDGGPAAASHMNWIIGPHHVVMPAYNRHADAAVRALSHAFPRHKVVASPANHILTGGGAFHCVTNNQPE
ncbi:agmatine deiminase family protein [Oceanicaulis sp. MMSF_3324]|uniref:agmatine deiminase family protein n=1 Tax=Oceanicaulis sp. MMSF_3324 TaxID=3046702 RepID=UPI00273E6A73|nr:agmatine deiminase family protein [Oceanicaulis sp. MMSF_3324]